MKKVIVLEGLDRLGKDTLIEGILHRCGYYLVCHFSKPRALDFYQGDLARYQVESFENAMKLALSQARIIFNRSWIGEAVYGPLYRGTAIDVFDLEERFAIDHADMRLILLYEDLTNSKHFTSDGLSFDDEKRNEEQILFLQAFEKSIIPDKRIITVTDKNGMFRPKEDILEEALA